MASLVCAGMIITDTITSIGVVLSIRLEWKQKIKKIKKQPASLLVNTTTGINGLPSSAL